eukprot:m.265373 g.265373  ORF g.265373 m.265373 type:complete len:189 (+) comp40487_c0_seq2:246-812(+)
MKVMVSSGYCHLHCSPTIQTQGESPPTSCPTRPKRLVAGVLAGCGLSSLFHSFTLVLGYFVKPVEKVCPLWSSSVTVIGYTVMFAAFLIVGPCLSPRIQKGNLQLWIVIQMALYGISFLTIGVCTGRCNSTSTPLTPYITEILFVVSFIPLAVGGSVCTYSVMFCVLRWFPARGGFSSANQLVFFNNA